MVSKQKQKGTNFEREILNILNEKLKSGEFKRVPNSGALGTLMGESMLTGDLNGWIKGFPRKWKAECKAGYSNKEGKEAKSITVQKEWLDKIRSEAEAAYSTPILFGKFDSVRKGTRMLAIMDVEIFIDLCNRLTQLQEEIDNG